MNIKERVINCSDLFYLFCTRFLYIWIIAGMQEGVNEEIIGFHEVGTMN